MNSRFRYDDFSIRDRTHTSRSWLWSLLGMMTDTSGSPCISKVVW